MSGVPFDLIIEQPAGRSVRERLPVISGFVQSSEPLPTIKILVNGVEQKWVKGYLTSDPNAPWDRQHTSHWTFRCDAISPSTKRPSSLTLEVYAGAQLVGVRKWKCKFRKFWFEKRQPLIYFIHIEKTAGTSLRTLLEQQRKASIIGIYNHLDFTPELICRSYSTESFEDLDVVFGHFAYGLHKCSHRPYKYISVLRRPEDFIKSYYLYIKYVSSDARFDTCAHIYEALEVVPDRAFDNLFTRYFSGNPFADRVNEADYTAAVGFVERDFAFVGLSETMEETTKAFCSYLGISYVERRENVTPFTDEAQTIDNEVLRGFLQKKLEWDFRLYKFVADRWLSSQFYLQPEAEARKSG